MGSTALVFCWVEYRSQTILWIVEWEGDTKARMQRCETKTYKEKNKRKRRRRKKKWKRKVLVKNWIWFETEFSNRLCDLVFLGSRLLFDIVDLCAVTFIQEFRRKKLDRNTRNLLMCVGTKRKKSIGHKNSVVTSIAADSLSVMYSFPIFLMDSQLI